MSNSTSYGPDEDEKTIVTERYFLAGDLLAGVGYGMEVVLYVACALYLCSQWRTRAYARYMLAFITLLFVVESIFTGVQTRTVQLMYVDNRNYPGGPYSYFNATQQLAVNVMFEATLFVMTFLCDSLVLWRCWVIWAATSRFQAFLAIFFPSIILLASFVMGTFWTLQSSKPGLSFYAETPLAFGTAYYTLSLGVNVILTVLIVIRLYIYRRRIAAALNADHARQYVTLGMILVESAAVYSVFALLFLITYAVSDTTAQIWLGVSSSVQQVATYVIIYRLADGRGWRQDSLPSSATFTSMQFNDGVPKMAITDVELGHLSEASNFHFSSGRTETRPESSTEMDKTTPAPCRDEHIISTNSADALHD
ncbi:uncharacterized protein STEHIDRAFT_92491 [Stereum hirsutum FP-91666 SS1]|uniref:uncharacterized protein n=1 Tax=Stereum hirsutum (strain FP-91666) TaxID=721885 RepID=UPI000440B239|nr:uncharacterized protein STEHIDRAFT_92491 [Stereum hirsutum FP-91666 SS1]EIM89910.1 hypothetical protein STEHIDRAFT_92491 [Stereum hirsutum FP-91666 SS1]